MSGVAVLLMLSTRQPFAQTTFTVDKSATSPWKHHWEESIGSGHAALTSRADWRAHLTRCAKELGVKRTRFTAVVGGGVFKIRLYQLNPFMGHNTS